MIVFIVLFEKSNSATSTVSPFSYVAYNIPLMILLLTSVILVPSLVKLISVIPYCANVCNSSACEIPSLFASAHILRSEKNSSSELITLSLLESKSVNASIPLVATTPLDSNV